MVKHCRDPIVNYQKYKIRVFFNAGHSENVGQSTTFL